MVTLAVVAKQFRALRMVTLLVRVCLKVMLQSLEDVKLYPEKKSTEPPEILVVEMLVKFAQSEAFMYVKLQLLAGQSLNEVSFEEIRTGWGSASL
jgi:hypothetical protein